MSTTCDLVAERVALGEPLGDAAEHAASCARCRRIAALPTELGDTRREVDPGLGFTARMTAGAQHRLVVRRRRRYAAGAAAALAATALGFLAVTHQSEQKNNVVAPAVQPPKQDKDPWDEPEDNTAEEDDVRGLLQLANTEHAMDYKADWAEIKKPLAPYRAVLEGVDHE